jgi:hypothetical protein
LAAEEDIIRPIGGRVGFRHDGAANSVPVIDAG